MMRKCDSLFFFNCNQTNQGLKSSKASYGLLAMNDLTLPNFNKKLNLK